MAHLIQGFTVFLSFLRLGGQKAKLHSHKAFLINKYMMQCRTETPGAVLTRVRFLGKASDFSPGVNFQCRLSHSVCTAPVSVQSHTCAHVKKNKKIPNTGRHIIVSTYENTAPFCRINTQGSSLALERRHTNATRTKAALGLVLFQTVQFGRNRRRCVCSCGSFTQVKRPQFSARNRQRQNGSTEMYSPIRRHTKNN